MINEYLEGVPISTYLTDDVTDSRIGDILKKVTDSNIEIESLL